MNIRELPLETLRRAAYALRGNWPYQCHQDIAAIRNFRLVCKKFENAGTESLFNAVVLYPEKNAFQSRPMSGNFEEPMEASDPRTSISKFTALQNSPQLRKLVRTAVLKTSIDDVESSHDSDRVTEEWREAVSGLSEFVNLSSIIVQFREGCFADENDMNWKTEDEEFRSDILRTIFRALNNTGSPLSKLRSLTIINLQNVNSPSVVNLPSFQAVLSQLTELHLRIATENVEASPENSIRLPELHSFFGDGLLKAWLQPIRQNLTHLTLYADTYWGWAPAFEALRSLHFPKLKYLALGNFTIAHDWQADWITSHGATLQTLIMDDCPILFFMYPSDALDEQPHVSHDDHIAIHTPDTDTAATGPDTATSQSEPTYWTYPTRWHQLFPRLSSGLPNLTKLVYGHGYSFDDRDVMRPDFHVNSYVAFHGGIGPSPWVEQYCGTWDEEVQDDAFDVFDDGISVWNPGKAEPPFWVRNEEAAGAWLKDGGADGGGGAEPQRGIGCRVQDEEALQSMLTIVAERAKARPAKNEG